MSPLYLLIKDHKGWSHEDGTPPPSRPICSVNIGYNRHLSEIVSLILEPLGHAAGGSDIDSTGGLLAKIKDLNIELKDKKWTESCTSDRDVEEEDILEKELEEDHKNEKKKESYSSFGSAWKSFSDDMKLMRAKRLRNLKMRNTCAPNIKARLCGSSFPVVN